MLHNLVLVTKGYPFGIDEEQITWVREQVIRNGRRAATRLSLGLMLEEAFQRVGRIC